MTVPRWLLADIEHIFTDTGYKHVVKTNTPCHLWLRWTITPPRTHSKAVLIRGLRLKDDLRFCFVTYHDNEQEEAGDTLEHTFIKEPWPGCETRYFYFHGTVGGQFSPSTTAIFTLHRVAPPYGPPITAYFYPDKHPEVKSVDGWVRFYQSRSTFLEIRNGPGNYAVDDSTAGYVTIQTGSRDLEWINIACSLFLFDTTVIDPGSLLVSAKFKIWGATKVDTLNILPGLVVVSSNPASNVALVGTDYATRGDTLLSIIIGYNAFQLAAWNELDFLASGLSAITKGGITKLALREALYDAPGIIPPWTVSSNSQFSFAMSEGVAEHTPCLEVTWRPPL